MKVLSAHQFTLFFCLACPAQPSFAALPPATRALQTSSEFCERTSRIFLQADLVKPGTLNPTNLELDLAPLIIQEVTTDTAASSHLPGFGSLRPVTNGLTLDSALPALYVIGDTVEFNARSHRRWTFLWFYSLEPAAQTNQTLPLQGLRMTLDLAGKPALCEVLADPASVDLVFVARNLEIAARERFGEPLPGRHFSIERSLSEAPNTFVAGILEDGPVPMGPIVYLSSGTHAVSTVTCRCTATQAKTLRQTDTYQLIGADDDHLQALLALVQTRLKSSVSFWPEQGRADNRAQRMLRLPASF